MSITRSDPELAGLRESVTENELVSGASSGDVAAFERLAAAHTDHLYTVVLRLVGDRSDAEDVVQETLLRAWRGVGRFQGRSLFSTWLYRIAVNETNRALEKRVRSGRPVPVDDPVLQFPAPAGQEPANRAEQREGQDAVDAAIAELDSPYRTALVLRDIGGLSTREAADIVDVGEAAFKSRVHQARLKVRALVGDEALTAVS